MIVAIASGKGGTGKTLVTAALAEVWPAPVVAVDLDVEAPRALARHRPGAPQDLLHLLPGRAHHQ